ncbi:hypothetical protein PSTT_14004 [Puccinia striiformis]|uniref:Uncharacterized protein n=1 Tax=Puccinia striiformis TaxID=27350 RepID=A0A2S4UP40_9BASI|nr:hypothetical protein PSTT_14004 [Puccinia striiformis]
MANLTLSAEIFWMKHTRLPSIMTVELSLTQEDLHPRL